MTSAIIETTGSGSLKGGWLAEAGRDAPDVAFLDEIDQLMAEKMLGQACSQIDNGAATWEDFLEPLQARQNMISGSPDPSVGVI